MTFFTVLLHFFHSHLRTISLSFVLCIGVGVSVGLLCYFFAEQNALVGDVRKKAAWIAAMCGTLVCCCIVFVSNLTLNPLTFAGFLIFGSVTSGGSALFLLTLGLPVLRGVTNTYYKDPPLKSHKGKKRLKD